MESVFRNGSLEQMVDEESKKEVSRRGFLGLLAGAGAWVGLGSKAQAREWSHPLYEVLYNNAMAHSPTKKDGYELRGSILALDRQSPKDAAYNLIPDYYPNDGAVGGGDKMPNPGGDNPTYWVALRLALEGIRQPFSYNAILNKTSDFKNILLPKNELIIEFSKHISPAKREQAIISRLNQISRFAKLFNYELLN